MAGPSGDLSARVAEWVAALDAEFLERAAAVRLAMLAPLSGHHLLLLGPPGTAKTMLATRITEMVQGKLFSTLLTKFSTPEDLFGPLSLPKLEQGIYERLTSGYLPSADVAFVDELFKANASILNSLLSILNERVFFNGSSHDQVPLLSMLAASNEVPDDDEGLGALDDRILLRICVDPLRETNSFARLVSRTIDRSPQLPSPFSRQDLENLAQAASKVSVPKSIVDVLLEVRESARTASLDISDRRWRQVMDIMAVCAALEGSGEILPGHLGVLRYALWRRPADQSKIVEALRAGIRALKLSTVTANSAELEKMLNECARKLDDLEKRSSNVGSYYAREAQEDFEKSALEPIHQARELTSSADEWRRSLERELGGPRNLWSPFWTEVLGGLALPAVVNSVRNHKFFSTCDARFPTLSVAWRGVEAPSPAPAEAS